MFEEYLQDSYDFFMIAQTAADESDDRKARRYYRGSVFYAAGAMEAFVNYTADAFAKAESLSRHEIAFLNDRILAVSPKDGTLVEQTRRFGIDAKLRFLFRKFVPSFELGTSTSWARFMVLKHLRDSLVHPRQSEDETEVADYHEKVHRGISAIIQLMNHVCIGIYQKPLRKQLLDLIPE